MVDKVSNDSYEITILVTNNSKFNFSFFIKPEDMSEEISFLKEKIMDHCRKNNISLYNFSTKLTPQGFIYNGIYEDPQNLFYYQEYFPIYCEMRIGFETKDYDVEVVYNNKKVKVKVNDESTFEDLIDKVKEKINVSPDVFSYGKKIIYSNMDKINKYPPNICFNEIDYNTNQNDYLMFYGVTSNSSIIAEKKIEVELDITDSNGLKIYIEENSKVQNLIKEITHFKKVSGLIELEMNEKSLTSKQSIKDLCSNNDKIKVSAEISQKQGGGDFVDLEAVDPITRKFSKTAANYRYCDRGNNGFGICLNGDCDAYKKEVICMLPKVKVFNLGETSTFCPLCGEQIEATHIGFFKCNYFFNGKKKIDGRVIRVKQTKADAKQAKDTDGIVVYEPQEKDGEKVLVKWTNLTITVFDLDDGLPRCIFCNKEIQKGDEEKLKCNCMSHKECSKKNYNCPDCSSNRP